MKHRRRVVTLLIPAICAILCGQTNSSRPGEIPRELIGTWVPVSAEDRMANGEIHYPVYGHYPRGYLTYDATGHMTVQLMNPEREKVGLRTASLEQFKAATILWGSSRTAEHTRSAALTVGLFITSTVLSIPPTWVPI